MQKQTVRVTDFDSHRLRKVIEGSLDLRDADSVNLLERQLADAEISPA